MILINQPIFTLPSNPEFAIALLFVNRRHNYLYFSISSKKSNLTSYDRTMVYMYTPYRAGYLTNTNTNNT